MTFYALPAEPWRPILLIALNLLTVAALLAGTRHRRPLAAAGWYLLAGAQILNAAAWACWYLYPVMASVTLQAPSVGDIMFLASYAMSSVALAWLARGHGARRGALVDAAILVTAVGVVAWVVFLARSAETGLSLPLLVVNFGYIALDVLLLGSAAVFAFTAGRSWRSSLLVAWAVVQLGADVAFNLQVLGGTFRLGNEVFAGWMVSMAVLSAAALQPASYAPRTTVHRHWQHVIMAVAVVPLPVLLVVRAVQSSIDDVWVIAGGSLLVTVLVVARLTTGSEHSGVLTGEARAGLRRSALRLSAGVLTLALLPLMGLVYLAINAATDSAESEVSRRLAASSDVSVAHVSAEMESLRQLVSSYAERRTLVQALSTGGSVPLPIVQDNLASLESRNDAFVGVWATAPDGTLLAFDPPQPALIGQNFAHRDYFQGAMRTRAPYVSDAFAGAAAGNPQLIAVSTPIFSGDRIVGLLGLGYRLDALASFTNQLADVQQVRLTLADRRGTLLAGPGNTHRGLLNAALAGRSGTGRDADDRTHLVAYRPVPELGWAVVADLPAGVAFAGARRFTGRVVAVASLLAQALLIGLLLAVRAERRRRYAEAELAQREEHVTAILQAAGDAFVATDTHGRITRWNTQAETTFGWPLVQALGQPLVHLVVPDDQRDAQLTWATAVQAGGVAHLAGQRVEVQARRRSGDLFAAELTVCSSTSKKATFSAFIRDITDRKEAEARLATTRDDALAASRLKSEFVANMSHEIRTPMNGVIGLTGLLLETNLDNRQRDYLTTVQNSAEALLNVINDILDFSKIEAGKLDIDVVDLDVRAVVEEVVSLLAATAQAKGLEIAAVVHPAIPPALRGDVHRIRQILTNLLANAVKFTEHGEVVVTVEVGRVDPISGAHRVTFAVSDTGIGIPADRHAHLFEAFTQVDASTTRRYGGTGLGLTISRQLVELMGGTIGVDSRPGDGSRFHFSLELSAATDASASQHRPAADLLGVRVLVVDDNATNRTVVADLLTSWGARPHSVADAASAVTAMHAAVEARDGYAVALLDMHMPDVDGLQLARTIAADTTINGTPLAMLTSTNTEAREARDCGIQAYLTKPVRAAQLHTTLLQILGHTTVPIDAEQPVTDTLPTQESPPAARILVAEDNEVNQQVAVEILASLGYTADVAPDGEQALRLLQSGHYDAVLMDCQMPVLDGYEATERIRRLPAPLNAIPVIALTASALAADEQRCRDAGMDEFLAKPMRKQHLADTLRSVLRRSAHEADRPPQDLIEPILLQELQEMGASFTTRVLPLYLHNAPLEAAAIAAAAAHRDMAELARLAHKLSGSSAALAGHHLAASCTAIQHAASEDDITTALSLTATIEQQTNDTCDALRALNQPTR